MIPVSPVVPGFEVHESTFAEHQPQYNNLPAIRCDDGQIFTRWRLSLKERIRVLLFGDIYLSVHTYNRPLQPLLISTEAPQLEQTTSQTHE